MLHNDTEKLEDKIYNETELSAISNKKTPNSMFSNFIDIRHYLCPLCHTFLKLILKENKKVYIYCKEIKGLEIDIQDYMEYNLSSGDIKEFALSDSINKYIGYCFDCKINISDRHSNEQKMHNIKYFNDMLDFITKKLKIPDMNKEFSKPGTFLPNQTNVSSYSYKLENVNNSKMKKVKKQNDLDNMYNENPFSDLIQIIINDSKSYPNYYIHYENIKNIFCYLSDQMEIEYHNYENGNLDIRIFGESFVKNNINNFILFINGKEEKLKEIAKVQGRKQTLKIKLIKINETTDLSRMFYKCDCLSKIYIINEWNTSNVTTMREMFYGCKALEFYLIYQIGKQIKLLI